MECNCKHHQKEIEDGLSNIIKLRELFIKRMTEDSETQDARKKEFNQAIFGFKDDDTTYCVWDSIDLDMVLRCFDDAVKDWRRLWYNDKECRRK